MNADHTRRQKAAAGGVTLALVAFADFPMGDAIIKSMAGLLIMVSGLLLWRSERNPAPVIEA